MKLKDMVYLHDVDSMREFLENNKIIGATDSEIKAFYEVFEGHGYNLFARDLNDSVFIRFDSCGSEIGDVDETDEECVSINSIEYELGYAYEMLEELYEEYYKNDEHESMIDCGNARNLVGDLISRTYDKDNVYIVSYSSTSNFSLGYDDTVEVFDNEVDAYKDIKHSIEFALKNYDVEEDMHECEDTNFNNEIEVKKYMIDYRERDEFLLIHDEGSLQIKLTIKSKEKEEVNQIQEEPKMEFYTLVDHYTRFDFYEDSVEVKHYKNKEEGLKEFNDLVEEYKDSWNIEEIGEFDDIKEYENDNIKYFGLYIDEQARIELSLEKVVL